MSQYLPIVLLAILAVVFGLLSLGASRLLAPRRPSAAKEAPYECGIVPSREPPERFPVSFYIVAMLFIMFDIEIVFLYPYAVERPTLGAFGFWAIVVFSVIFFLTFVYEVARGGLDWGPRHEYRRLDRDAAMISPERDSSSTIRRVGLEGRIDRVGLEGRIDRVGLEGRTDLVTAGGAASTPDDGVAA
jgi:NADH-quinone oxidoreductase subunit A